MAVVGKGVCFDSGGLDIKPSSGMLLMKKDMGGAAHALALAGLVMGSGLQGAAAPAGAGGRERRRRQRLPARRRAASRAGITVEIGNTDAEGRLVLGDALARAGEEKPELILDFATLTGAARVGARARPAGAVRAQRRDRRRAARRRARARRSLLAPAAARGYREWLKSDIADINNSHSNGFAGASVAALFLDKFVPEGTSTGRISTPSPGARRPSRDGPRAATRSGCAPHGTCCGNAMLDGAWLSCEPAPDSNEAT